MQTETVTIGTYTADESDTLDKLLCLGITACTTAETTDSTNVKSSKGPHKSDIPSIPLPSTSTATTSRHLTSKAKATETKSHVKLNTLDENPPEDIPSPSDIETDKHDDPATIPDVPESIPLSSTSTATTSRQLTSKAKATETKSHVKLNTLDENPPEDIPLPSDIEMDKHDDPATIPDAPESIEEPKYMRLCKTYIKSDLHVSLTRLSNDEIQQKTCRKALKTHHKAITNHIPRPVTIKANPSAARKYIFKLTRYGVRRKNHKNYHHTCVAKKCNAIFKSLQEWNDHHCHCHPRLTYTCRICGKVSITPSSFRDHKYYHRVKKFECSRCHK